jgi:hypothetical protein
MGTLTTATFRRLHFVVGVAAVTLALVVAGCGSSSSSPAKVSAASYVNSVCTAAGSWYRSIQTAGQQLETTVHKAKSVSEAKTAYSTFIDGLLHATERAEQQLKNAGAPSVSNGTRISTQVIHAFDSAKRGLSSAAGQIRNVPTSSPTAFESAASHVQATVQHSLQGMSSLAPQKSAELHTAAAKDHSCQALRALGG